MRIFFYITIMTLQYSTWWTYHNLLTTHLWVCFPSTNKTVLLFYIAFLIYLCLWNHSTEWAEFNGCKQKGCFVIVYVITAFNNVSQSMIPGKSSAKSPINLEMHILRFQTLLRPTDSGTLRKNQQCFNKPSMLLMCTEV